MNRHRILALALAAASALAVLARAQSAAPRFEVTSVRLWVSGSGVHLPECSGDHYSVSGVHFGNILQWAYDLQPGTGAAFLQRVPESIRTNSYEIQGKAAGAIESESQCRLMVQALLADRFKLAFHYETTEAELFDLVVARGGPKLQKALPADEGTDVNFVLNGIAYTHPPIADADTRLHTKGVTMRELAQWLTNPARAPQPVADKTGLEGRYKIDVRISTSLPTDGQDSVDPSLEAALAKVGLRLEKHKGSVKVPVLDHIEAPDPN